jgi:hypothetical protein
MSKKTSLEQYALFYEKIESNRPGDGQVSQIKKEISYDKAPSLTEDQIKALSNDLKTPAKAPQGPHQP